MRRRDAMTPSVEGHVALGCVRQAIVNLQRELTRAESVSFIKRDHDAMLVALKGLKIWLAAESIIFEDMEPTTQAAKAKVKP